MVFTLLSESSRLLHKRFNSCTARRRRRRRRRMRGLRSPRRGLSARCWVKGRMENSRTSLLLFVVVDVPRGSGSIKRIARYLIDLLVDLI